VEVRGGGRVLRRVRLGDRPRMAAVTFEELRITYQSDEQMARELFRQLVVAEAAATIAQAHRVRAENKLAQAMPRRINRDREGNR
jgi:hypothetical protein